MKYYFSPFLLFLLISNCSQSPQKAIGVKNNKLLECPNSPNCVSSQTGQVEKVIDPIQFNETASNAFLKLKKILESIENAKIIKEENNYIHAEFRSSLFNFIDDVEFLIDEEKRLIHIRSASRSGYYDFGVNRKRVYDINFRYAQSHEKF